MKILVGGIYIAVGLSSQLGSKGLQLSMLRKSTWGFLYIIARFLDYYMALEYVLLFVRTRLLK